MKVEILQYTAEKGRSTPNFPDLDSGSTLIFVFCAPKFIPDLTPIKMLTQHYPKSKMIGCSTPGEISPCETGSCVLHNQTMTLTSISERI